MDTDTTPEVEPDEAVEAEPETNGQASTSLMDELRQSHTELVNDRTVDITLPGYHGRLVARYKRLSFREVQRIGNRVEKMRSKNNPMAALYGQCDVLAEALIGIQLRKDLNKPEDLEPLSHGFPQLGEGEVLWDGAAKLVLPDDAEQPTDARSAMRAMFGYNDLAVPQHQSELAQWMSAARAEDEEDSHWTSE